MAPVFPSLLSPESPHESRASRAPGTLPQKSEEVARGLPELIQEAKDVAEEAVEAPPRMLSGSGNPSTALWFRV